MSRTAPTLPNPLLHIDGGWRQAFGEGTFRVIDPAAEQEIAYVAAATASDVDPAVLAARREFDGDVWSKVSGPDRVPSLLRFAELIDRDVETLASLEVPDTSLAASTSWAAGPASRTHRASPSELPRRALLRRRPTSTSDPLRRQGTSMTFINEITFDELDLDPYPTLARLRAEAPVVFLPMVNAWMVTRWDDCAYVAGSDDKFGGASNDANTHRVFGQPNILTADGELHKELRSSVDPHYRPRAVNGYVDALARPIAEAQVAAIRDRDEIELIGDYLEPISVLALAGVLGIPDLDEKTLRRWFHELIVGSANAEMDPALFARSDAVSAEIEERLDPLLEELAAHPNGSSLSHMLHDGMPAGEVRSSELVYPSLKLIIAGGMQEPGHGAGSTMLGLLQNPDQLGKVVADHKLIPKAIGEGLRWLSPIGHCERQPFQDEVIGGVTIPGGAAINVMLSSANRDETRYERAEEFVIDRKETSHMAFGGGNHFCSGHYFARQIERIALEELLSAFPDMRLDEEREVVVRGWVFRAPRQLPVRLND